MLNLLKGAWAGLDSVGRTTLIICVAVVLVAAILSGVDLRAAWALLGYNVDSVFVWLGVQ